MWWPNLTPFMPVLVLITRVIHRSTLHFAAARNIVHKSNTWEKTWQVENVEPIEQYDIEFVETSHYLKRRGRKAFVEWLFWIFAGHNLHRLSLHSAVARNIVHKSNTREKTWQVESVEHIEQYDIKFVETSHYLKRRGRKAFVEWLFSRVIICITE